MSIIGLPRLEDLDSDNLKGREYQHKLEEGLEKLRSELDKTKEDIKRNFTKQRLEEIVAETSGILPPNIELDCESLEIQVNSDRLEIESSCTCKIPEELNLPQEALEKFLSHALSMIIQKDPLIQYLDKVTEETKKFMDALVGLSEITHLFEPDNGFTDAKMYVVVNDRVYEADIRFEERYRGELVASAIPLIYLKHAGGIEETVRKDHLERNAYMVTNPSKVVNPTAVFEYASDVLRDRYIESHPEFKARLDEEKQRFAEMVAHALENALGIPGVMDKAAKHLYKNQCPTCPKLGTCKTYDTLFRMFGKPENEYVH